MAWHGMAWWCVVVWYPRGSWLIRLFRSTRVTHNFSFSLRGAARFEEQDGRTVLYLDGTPGTYAETPALPFQQTDLTIGLWIKRFPSPSKRQMFYGDWSSPHQFRFDVMTDNRLCVDVRRESSVEKRLLNFCTPRA